MDTLLTDAIYAMLGVAQVSILLGAAAYVVWNTAHMLMAARLGRYLPRLW